MDDKELHDTIIELYIKYADLNVVAEKLGISVELVKKHVALARLPHPDRISGEKIPLDEIDSERGSREIGDLKNLIENIKNFGLLQYITVYQKSDTKRYTLLAGQRRYSAFVELNKKYPGEGWDKIPAIVMDDSDGGSTIDVPPAEV